MAKREDLVSAIEAAYNEKMQHYSKESAQRLLDAEQALIDFDKEAQAELTEN